MSAGNLLKWLAGGARGVQDCSGLSWSRKGRENKVLFKVREKSRSFVSSQGISKFLFKVRKSQGILFFKIILLDVFM